MIRGTFAAALLLAAVSAAGNEEFQLMHDGGVRTYRLYVPSFYKAESLLPLVVVLHGRSSNAARMEQLTGFTTRAEEHGFLVVYPEAKKATWNYLHGISGYEPRPNDSGFLIELLDTLIEKFSIDANRVYVAGISNGGFMAQRLACYAPEKFAAFASVAAGGYGAMFLGCKRYSPVNILFIHGTDDALVPWRGLSIEDNAGKQQLVTMSITDSLKFWSERNHCGPEVSGKELPQSGSSPGTSVRFLTARDCEDGAEVSLYAIVGGGHNWPGNRGVIPPDIAGAVNTDINASDVIWAFFQRHELVD